jgi:HEXXH motif-containing protein
MKLHLLDFGSFVLAAKLMAGFGEYECPVKADAQGRVVLPGTGVYFESGDIVPNQQVYVRTSGGNISARSTGQFNNTLRIRRCAVPMLKAGIEFNPIDTHLRLPDHSTFEYENLTLMEFIRWLNLLNSAWKWVEEQDTALTTEMKMILRAVVPVKRADKHIHTSGSFKEAPGLIALSWDDDVPVLAEALVHEYHHQKLNALLNLDRLIEGPTFEAIYPSPWRKDARPLLGILHGVYTFQAVLRFWIKLLATKEVESYKTPIRKRTHTLHSQLLTALATLQEYAIWSPLGEAFFEAIREAVVELGCYLPEAR